MRVSRVLLGIIAGAALLDACGSGSPSSTATTASTGSTPSRSSTTSTTTPLARGAEEPRSDIPWKQVGPGWVLAQWSSLVPSEPDPSTTVPPGQTTSLFLVNPDGGRYLVTTLPYSQTQYLTAWSGDGTRALLADASGTNTAVTEINLQTGARHSFTVAGNVAIAYSNPHGLAFLATTQVGETLERLSTSGALEQTYPTSFSGLGKFNASSASSPDGTQIAMGAAGGIGLVANDGTVLATLAVPGSDYCTPARWWTSTEVLASCTPTNQSVPLLWLVPTTGGSPTQLTVTPPTGNPDNGDLVAWQVGSDTYLQDAGGCGYLYLAELNPDHTTHAVTVPEVVQGDSQIVIGTVGEQIGLQTTIACGAGESVLWFDPQTNLVNVVLGPGMNGGGVEGSILFGDDNGSFR